MQSSTAQKSNFLLRVYKFYIDGFRNMTVGRTLWKVIFIKLIIMFAVLKLFFFPNFLTTNFTTDKERADYVFEEITQSAHIDNVISRRY